MFGVPDSLPLTQLNQLRGSSVSAWLAMTGENGEEIPQASRTKSMLHSDSVLFLVIIDVGHSARSLPEEYFEQVSSVILEDERMEIRVSILLMFPVGVARRLPQTRQSASHQKYFPRSSNMPDSKREFCSFLCKLLYKNCGLCVRYSFIVVGGIHIYDVV